MVDLISVLLIVAGFQVKHFICDGVLQTKSMVDAKSHYGRKLGVVHAAVHGMGTAVILLFLRPPSEIVLGLAVADFLLHYHIDYCKENIVKRAGWTIADAKYWWAMSLDQTLHHLTYLALTYLALTV